MHLFSMFLMLGSLIFMLVQRYYIKKEKREFDRVSLHSAFEGSMRNGRHSIIICHTTSVFNYLCICVLHSALNKFVPIFITYLFGDNKLNRWMRGPRQKTTCYCKEQTWLPFETILRFLPF
jgi:hypothetical protein